MFKPGDLIYYKPLFKETHFLFAKIPLTYGIVTGLFKTEEGIDIEGAYCVKWFEHEKHLPGVIFMFLDALSEIPYHKLKRSMRGKKNGRSKAC